MSTGTGPRCGKRVGLASTSSVAHAHQLGRLEAPGLIAWTGRDWSTCVLGEEQPARRPGLRSQGPGAGTDGYGRRPAPDLPRLRTLETWAAHYLTRIRTRIAALERQQAPVPTAAPAQATVGPGRARTPDWGLAEAGIGAPVTEVHRGDCWARGRSLVAVSAECAPAELADGAQPCAVCRPDRVLNRP
ncbi:DUF6233 domain-containing protein [Streptomyces globisporus]|uniref:DUF6233 domain-containing protein n=1 Tax=Streptomyces globisporus TaxID=1908 RepID=UPI0036674FEA